MSDTTSPARPPAAFDQALERLLHLVFGARDYELAAAHAAQVLPTAPPGLPQAMVGYVLMFSDAYRRWQVSYAYSEVRTKLILALCYWRSCVKDAGSPAVDELTTAVEHLTFAVCAHVRTENAHILGNVASARHWAEVAKSECDRVTVLTGAAGRTADARVDMWRKALRDYVRTYKLLHEGMWWVTSAYVDGISDLRIARAEDNARRLLTTEGGEWAGAELSAHVWHLKEHLKHRQGRPASGLTLVSGRIVLCLFGAVGRGVATRVVERFASDPAAVRGRLRDFATTVISPVIVRRRPEVDVFETELGANMTDGLTLSFDRPLFVRRADPATAIPDDAVDAQFSPLRWLSFDVEVHLLKSGAIWVSFGHTINEADQGSAGHAAGSLTPGDVRALRALLCPHAGEYDIRIGSSDGPGVRLDSFCRSERVDLEPLYRAASNHEAMRNVLGTIAVRALAIERSAAASGGWPTDADISALRDSSLDDEARRVTEAAIDSCTKLSVLAEHLLNRLTSELDGLSGETRESTEATSTYCDRNVDWFSHVLASRFAREDGGAVDSLTIADEDVFGFAGPCREIRSGFDDWRRLARGFNDHENVAAIRGHVDDLCYVTENSSFLHFPDDPRWVSEQFQMTIEVIRSVGTRLRQLRAAVDRAFEPSTTGVADRSEAARREMLALVKNLEQAHAEVARSGAAKYRDHGLLIGRLSSVMGLDRGWGLVERDVERLTREIGELGKRIEERRSDRAKNLHTGLGALISAIGFGLGASRINEVVTGLSQFSPRQWSSWATVGCFVLAGLAAVIAATLIVPSVWASLKDWRGRRKQ